MADMVPWINYQAQRVPQGTALEDLATGQVTTYARFAANISRAAGLLQQRGITKGDRVAILARNDSRVFEVLYACARIGAIAVPINWRLTLHELQAICADFTPSLLIHDEHNQEIALELCRTLGSVPSLGWTDQGQGRYDQEREASAPVETVPGLTRSDPWVMIYTSGTTGMPKGAVHSFASVLANIENSAYAGEVNAQSVALTVLPTFHVAGLNLYANAALMNGGSVLLAQAFDAEQTLQLFQDEHAGVTHFCGVPANFQLMAALPGFETATLRPIVATVGGSPVPRQTLDVWSKRGVKMMAVFGATEAGSTLLAMPPRGSSGKSAVGIPVIHAEACIRDLDGNPVANGQVGELWLRGPMLMSSYWNKPDETAAAIDVAGWLHTGDAALCDDDGIFHIVDRWKDMYISGGENVYPAEVENVLYQHPAVLLAAVVGHPDPKWGEVGIAHIVLNGSECTAEQLRSWCSERLARYKVPTRFEFVADLPRNATGKIQKNLLSKVSI